MNYYNQKITNRTNIRNDNDELNNNVDNKVTNPYINKKLYEHTYQKSDNTVLNAPFENTVNTNFNNFNQTNNNTIVTSPFYNKQPPNNTINNTINNNTINNTNNNTINNNNSFFGNFNKPNESITGNKNDQDEDDEEEPPLLEELGINFDLISKRMKSVFTFYKIDHTLFENSDLSGPLLIILSLGFILLLVGKASFSYIYLIGIVSSLSMYLLLNVMSQNATLDLYCTISMLGYALLPLVILSFISILINLRSKKGYTISFFCISWSALTASKFFEAALRMNSQRYLIAYPIFLLYSCFALIIIF
ncbi:protein transport protein YIP1, putative [Plasmodium yoelii]|nr:protein transport protein YIP1, putative [Plasmodium yoelii]CDU20020.1 Yip1 protein, putative [Plasmodium yoelii]VTZ80778.1 protein transport protein YIP1, putative [Plasmodium yoelii]|eukprot:XP_022813644.2 protein transport protein YIP1, putative [Plasmodium yoelii]